MRIAVAGLCHETNTFAEGVTRFEHFERAGGFPALTVGEEIVAALHATKVPMGGFIAAAEELGFELVPIIWTFAQPSGIVMQNAYEKLAGMLLDGLQKAMPIDGVLLDLHGAMVTEELEDGEGELLARIRHLIGPDIPIMVTLDLHANITPAMAAEASALIGYDTYPHVDCFERGIEAAHLLVDTISGHVQPTTGLAQIDMLIGPPRQCTLLSPMKDIFALVHEIEQRPGILAVTLAAGFPFSDTYNTGPCAVVSADGDQHLAQESAEEVAELLWQRREQFRLALTPVEEAIRYAVEQGAGPVILADGSDNPGGGAPCDGTVMLEALISAQAPRATVAIMVDPEAVGQAIAAGVGKQVSLTVGGKTDDRHGAPLTVTGYVRLISDGNYRNQGPMMTGLSVAMGRTVVFVVGDVEILLTEQAVQPYDMQVLRSVGIEPTRRLIIGLKSSVHFRADYQEMATRIFEVDTPGVHNPDVTQYTYRRLRRPMWPLDEE